MARYIIANLIKGDTLVGYRVYDTTADSCSDLEVGQIYNALRQTPDLISNAELKNGKILGTNGSLTRLTQIYNDGSIRNPAFFILGKYEKIFIVCNHVGKIRKCDESQIISACSSLGYGIANGKIVGNYVSAIRGEFPKFQTEDEYKKNDYKAKAVEKKLHSYKTKDGLLVVDNPRVFAEGLNDLTDGVMAVKFKVQRAFATLREFRPFYACILEGVTKVPTLDVETAAVTVSELLYNPIFINSLTIEETTFVFLHEALHLACLHLARGKGKDPKIANIAGDLYINRLITYELGAEPGGAIIKPKTNSNVGGICFPKGGLYSKDIDVKKDTFESIYAKLMEENGSKLQQMKNKPSDGSEGGQGSSSGGNQQGGQQNGNQNRQQGGSQNGQNSDGQNGQQDGQDEGESLQTQSAADITYNGKKVGTYYSNDLAINKKDLNATKEEIASKQKSKLADAKQREEKIKGIGSGQGLLDKTINAQLAPKVKWETVVTQKLTALGDSYRTFAKVNRRNPLNSSGEKLRLRGEKQDYDKLEGVKVCIDTSGSMSDIEIGKCLGQLDQLMKKYKAKNSELIYWDAGIESIGKFDDMKEALKVKIKGGGGTDVEPVFEYLADRRKCKVPPTLVVIFSDGCFYSNGLEKYKKQFNNITVWVINNGEEWNAPFGKVARLKEEI